MREAILKLAEECKRDLEVPEWVHATLFRIATVEWSTQYDERAALRRLTDYLAEKVGIVTDDDGGHDSLCESEFITGAMGNTPCDCDHRASLVRAALARLDEK